ncbi:MAG: Rieske (2Fe-2S) protein [Rhodobacterales bacterium]|nr:Rieske (2Fe-2S) protein [Rhodobacterales bacterium]
MDTWYNAGPLEDLVAAGRRVIKHGGKQVALFHDGNGGALACNNRCPHEGYPLAEGCLSADGRLTCNWHNWKFDLRTGAAEVGGDAVRVYPTAVRDGAVWIDLTDPDPEEIRAAALAGLKESFRDHDFGRMVRETARLEKAGGSPRDALAAAIAWTHDRFEYGMTHALGAAPDWLALGDRYATDAATRLIPYVETIGYLCWDSLREPAYPFIEARLPWDEAAFAAAVEAENEGRAVALVRGALGAGLAYADLEPALTRAALAHYQDYGHALIYTCKAGELVAALGPDVAEPVTLALVRGLVSASREDLIPEFKAYAPTLAAWEAGEGGADPVTAADFRGLGVERALARALASARHPDLFDALLGASARALLHYDLAVQDRTDGPVSANVGWLGFTHMLTFADAARRLGAGRPDPWSRVLLQMACFLGRTAKYCDWTQDTAGWAVAEPRAFLDGVLAGLFDHGQPEYIVSAHLVKVGLAVDALFTDRPDAPWAPDLLAAHNRFLHEPFKRKHLLRAVRQSLGFVANEG